MTELRKQISSIVEDHQECLTIAKSVNASKADKWKYEIAVVSAVEPTGIDRKKIWIKRNKNLLQKFIRGSYYDANYGRIAEYSIFVRTDYVPVEVGGKYVLSHDSSYEFTDMQAHFFDANKKHLGSKWYAKATEVITISNTSTKYLLINLPNANKEDLTWMQLEKGEEPSEYEPYTSTQSAYIKNDNDVYQQITDSLIIDL